MQRVSPWWSSVVLAGAWGSGCADPCVDDGFGQEACEVVIAGTTGGSVGTLGTSGSATEITASTGTMDATAGDSSDDAETTTADASGDAGTSSGEVGTTEVAESSGEAAESSGPDTSETGTTALWCTDADMDGFGDPDACVMAEDPPPGTVDNDDDCDDEDAATFPGAATQEPELCARDADGDGWGDASPGASAEPGADCFDGNAALNPDTMGLGVMFSPSVFTSTLVEVSATDATLSLVAAFPVFGPFWNPVSVTIEESGRIVMNNDVTNRLEEIDYAGVCEGGAVLGTSTALPQSHGVDVLCGISFGVDGALFGVRNDTDEIVELDPITGAIVGAAALVVDGVPFDAGSCGMTFDCHTGQLLFADGVGGDIFAVDPTTGDLTLLADTDGTWSPTGLAYEPVERVAWVSGGAELHRVALDGSDTVETIGTFDNGTGDALSLSNLEVLPICAD